MTQNIREQISRRSGPVEVQHAESRLPPRSTESLGSINDEFDALNSRIQSGEPTPASVTVRGRIGSLLKNRLYRFLWWQNAQIKALAALTLKRGREEKSVLDALSESIGTLSRENREIHQLVFEYRRLLQESENRLQRLQSDQVAFQTAEIERNLRSAAELDAERSSLRQELSAVKNALELREARITEQVTEKIAGLDQQLEAESAQKEQLSARLSQLAARLSELGLFTHQTRASLSIQDRRLGLFLEEARKGLPQPIGSEQLLDMAREHTVHKYDSLYAEFEDVLRGTREEIKARQEVYLPFLKSHGIGSPALPLLDLGCGRGEWLELLGEHGLQAVGVDRNDAMVERCKSFGLTVVQDDALPYLSALPDASLGAVTSFHMVEHMPFDVALTMIDESLRVLKPGGILILETPNPHNMLVGSHNFYLDPTHHKPLPSQMLRFFVEARGFCDAHVLDLHPYPEPVRFADDGNSVASRLNDYFYGPQDYAVIGRKAPTHGGSGPHDSALGLETPEGTRGAG